MFSKADKVDKSQYEDKLNEIASLNRELITLRERTESQMDTIEDLNSKLEMHKLEVEDFKSRLQIEKYSVASKVNNALASVGVTNFAVETISNLGSLTPVRALETFNALPVEKKHDFYTKHKDLLTKAIAEVNRVQQ